MTKHKCLDDLANLRPEAADPDFWLCQECREWVHIGRVVEALRVRAVAQDAAERNRTQTYEDWVRGELARVHDS